MRINVTDRFGYSTASKRVIDSTTGFMSVPARVARTGIQTYRASELGLKDRDANAVVKVYRPPEEVFNEDSLKTYQGADITDDHPKGFVNSESYTVDSKGVVLNPGRKSEDGDFVEADILIKDKGMIKKVNDGKVELSAGYSAEYDNTPGTTPEGEDYDFIQRDIKVNHVAVVHRGRAGPQARIHDHKGANMPQITLDTGRSVDVTAENAGQIIDQFDRNQNEITNLTKKVQEMQDSFDAQQALIDTSASEIESLKAMTSDEAIRERIIQVNDSHGKARMVAGDKFTTDSVDQVTVYREALAVFDSSKDWKDKPDAYVTSYMDIITSDENLLKKQSSGKPENFFKDHQADDQQQQQKQVTSFSQDFQNQGAK